MRQAGRQLLEYLAGKRIDFTVPLCSKGTEYQKQVWRQITGIPYGQTITYSELAERTGAPRAIRAAAAATGKNPLSIVIPCHRVMGKGGALTGYAGGLRRKHALLEIEQAAQVLRPALTEIRVNKATVSSTKALISARAHRDDHCVSRAEISNAKLAGDCV